MPKIYNKKYDKNIPKEAIYVGRPTKWGNLFSHLDHGLAKFKTATREEAVEAYDKWLDTQPDLLAALPELKGKDLVCWCAPLACHCSVLIRRANTMPNWGEKDPSRSSFPDPNEYEDSSTPSNSIITIKSGNLIDATEQMLVHQANCFNTMGTGVALALRTKWPKVYIADCETVRGDKSKLGSFSKTWINQKQIVINMYGQYAYGPDKQYTDYEAVTKAFNAICELAVKLKITTIAIPYKMGCNNAGGDWNVISTIIENAAKKHNLSIVAYQY